MGEVVGRRDNLGKRVGDSREEGGRFPGDFTDRRRSRLEGGEKGGGLLNGHSGNSKVAGANRRTTLLYQGWLGVGFFKHSRGNCGVFREAVFALRFRPAREPLTTPEIHLVIGRSATAHLNGLKFICVFVFYRER